MKKYETVLIFKPQLNDDEIKKEVERFEGLLKEHGAEIEEIQPWGRRELAFEMNKCNYGVYQVFLYKCANGEVVDTVNSVCRINDGLLKFQTHRASDTERGFKGNPKLLKEKKEKQEAVAAAS